MITGARRKCVEDHKWNQCSGHPQYQVSSETQDTVLLSCQPIVTVTSCFVYKAVRD